MKKRIVLLCSGRGSNFDAILDANLSIQVLGLICDQKDAAVIRKAEKRGIPVLQTRDESTMLAWIKETQTEWVILAGYMRILSPAFVDALRSPRGYSRITNIHPSLLPAFPGLAGYEQAFQYGCKVLGVTIHLVEPEMDQGPILAQESFSIDSLNSLDEIEKLGLSIEHKLYPKTLAWVLEERFEIETRQGRSCVRTF